MMRGCLSGYARAVALMRPKGALVSRVRGRPEAGTARFGDLRPAFPRSDAAIWSAIDIPGPKSSRAGAVRPMAAKLRAP